MIYYEEIDKLIQMTVHEIDQIKGGLVADYAVINAIQKILESEKPDQEKIYSLEKLIWRSPEVDDYIEYGDVIYKLQNHEIDFNHGENLLTWVLSGIVHFCRFYDYELFLHDYLDFGRALLYKGKPDYFLKILTGIISKTQLTDYLFTCLVSDFARLGYTDLARKLEERGENFFGERWNNEEIVASFWQGADENNEGIFVSAGFETNVLTLLSVDNLIIDDSNDDFEGLSSIEEVLNSINADLSAEEYIPYVPDIIRIMFKFWDNNPDIRFSILKILGMIQRELLPEFSFMGDLLFAQQKQIFISEHFGKYHGFTFEHLVEYARDETLATDLQVGAAKMLLDLGEKNEHYRDQVVGELTELLSEQSTDNYQSELKVSLLAAHLLSTEYYEFKSELTKAFNEDRVDPVYLSPKSFKGDWALEGVKWREPEKGKPINLTCHRCHRTRVYGYDYLLMNIDLMASGLEWDSRILFTNRVIRCVKCGALEDYHVGSTSLAKLFSKNFFENSGIEFNDDVSEDIFFVSFNVIQNFGFTEKHLGGVRQKVISGQEHLLHPVELGDYYRLIGWFNESLLVFRQAHANNPNDRNIGLLLACVEHDFDDRSKAREYYQNVLTMGKGDILNRIDSPAIQNALTGLKRLNEGKSSPLPYPTNSKKESLLNWLMQAKKRHKRKR